MNRLNRLNRRTFTLSALAGTTALTAAACGAGGDSGSGSSGDTVIKVASHLPPMTDVVTTAAEVGEEGYTIELVQVSDNVQYNRLLADGEVDANFAQHEPFMQAFNEENDAQLVLLDKIYDAKVGFYSQDYDDIEQIPQHAKVAIANDASNEGRALAMLNEQGLITLPEGAGFDGRVGDIVDDPLDLEFLQIDLLNLPSAYEEEGMALVYSYPSYIEKVGLTPADALFLEETVDQRFSISLIAREDNQDSEKIQVLRRAMTSDAVRSFLEDEHSATLIPSF